VIYVCCAAIGNDLLDLLLGARDENGEPMSDVAVQDESINFIGAGAETTSNLITWLVYRLVTIPEHWQTVHTPIVTLVDADVSLYLQ
jgi:cytochrome P450